MEVHKGRMGRDGRSEDHGECGLRMAMGELRNAGEVDHDEAMVEAGVLHDGVVAHHTNGLENYGQRKRIHHVDEWGLQEQKRCRDDCEPTSRLVLLVGPQMVHREKMNLY